MEKSKLKAWKTKMKEKTKKVNVTKQERPTIKLQVNYQSWQNNSTKQKNNEKTVKKEDKNELLKWLILFPERSYFRRSLTSQNN